MILMHGTSKANGDIIACEGLKPRSKKSKGNWFRDCHRPSIDKFVYLTQKKDYAEFHAARTAVISNSDCCIIELEVDDNNLWPDENLFAESRLLTPEDVKKYQKRVLKNKNKWKESIDKIAAVAHEGPIDSSNIVSYKVFGMKESVFYPFVRDMPNQNIDSFDISLNAYMKLGYNGWFHDKTVEGDNVETMMRDFKIYKVCDTLYRIEFRGERANISLEGFKDV